MQTGNSIIIQAPRETIFATAADLARWPRILPHYRYIHFLRRLPDRSIVKMAAVRSGIPISWTSEFVIDRERMELRFLHLKAFTRGMRVIWTFKETPCWSAGRNHARVTLSRSSTRADCRTDYRQFFHPPCCQPKPCGR